MSERTRLGLLGLLLVTAPLSAFGARPADPPQAAPADVYVAIPADDPAWASDILLAGP